MMTQRQYLMDEYKLLIQPYINKLKDINDNIIPLYWYYSDDGTFISKYDDTIQDIIDECNNAINDIKNIYVKKINYEQINNG